MATGETKVEAGDNTMRLFDGISTQIKSLEEKIELLEADKVRKVKFPSTSRLRNANKDVFNLTLAFLYEFGDLNDATFPPVKSKTKITPPLLMLLRVYLQHMHEAIFGVDIGANNTKRSFSAAGNDAGTSVVETEEKVHAYEEEEPLSESKKPVTFFARLKKKFNKRNKDLDYSTSEATPSASPLASTESQLMCG